jgi:hypothetical protein
MKPVSIPRGFFEDDDPRPCWIPLVTGDPPRRCKPAIRCKCGMVTCIGLHHVHADGTVTASFIHDKPEPEACGWHVHLFLEGYAEEIGIDFPPEKD